MELLYCSGEDGYAYYSKGHVPLKNFMDALVMQTDENDSIRHETPTHTWKRIARNFQERHQVIIDADPESRGAFRVTWIESA